MAFTGRDMIRYILDNNLENHELNGFVTPEELAVEIGYGPDTVLAMVDLGIMQGFKIGDKTFVIRPNIKRVKPLFANQNEVSTLKVTQL